MDGERRHGHGAVARAERRAELGPERDDHREELRQIEAGLLSSRIAASACCEGRGRSDGRWQRRHWRRDARGHESSAEAAVGADREAELGPQPQGPILART
eukprot:7649043-Lingulodinium_polyedra.AAC.1